MSNVFRETYNKNGIQEYQKFVGEMESGVAHGSSMQPPVNDLRINPTPTPAAAPDPMKAKDANGTALQTAINNANQFRGERDALAKEVERLKAELEKQKPKAVDHSEAEIARARAQYGLR